VLTRKYKGDTVQVKIRASGFEYAGAVYGSLSAVASCFRPGSPAPFTTLCPRVVALGCHLAAPTPCGPSVTAVSIPALNPPRSQVAARARCLRGDAVFNAAPFLDRSISSLRIQTFADWNW
jgi:hypothetical protein